MPRLCIVAIFCLFVLGCYGNEEVIEHVSTDSIIEIVEENGLIEELAEIVDEDNARINDIQYFQLLTLSKVYAQYDFMHGTNFGNLRFHAPNIVERLHPNYETWSVDIVNSGTYFIEHVYGVPFITFFWNDGIHERFLMLINELFMLLYSSDNRLVHRGQRNELLLFNGGAATIISLLQMHRINASSTLREGNIIYSATPERLGLNNINQVWAVEGGVGEKLHITLPPENSGILYISIGYVHFSRPYLFLYNSRPKRIRISVFENESIFIEHELTDTPNFQRIPVVSDNDRAWYWGRAELLIEILEVFPGSRFNHMCINSIVMPWAP